VAATPVACRPSRRSGSIPTSEPINLSKQQIRRTGPERAWYLGSKSALT
jgi:hypothetical protein